LQIVSVSPVSAAAAVAVDAVVAVGVVALDLACVVVAVLVCSRSYQWMTAASERDLSSSGEKLDSY
jgi:hypothetical protein